MSRYGGRSRRIGPGRTVAAWVIAGVLPGAPALGQPAVEESAKRLEALVKEEAAAPAAQRAEVLAHAIQARRELLALAPNDDRLATWLLDQAGAVLEFAGRDGAELSVLYGVPTGAQRTREREAAKEAAELVDRAEGAAAASVAKLETEVFAARGDAARAKAISARVEERMHVLVDVEGAWRIPALRARAAVVSAAALDGPAALAEQRKAGKAAAAALGSVRGPDDASELSRAVWLCTAQMLAGEGLEAMHRFAEIEGAEGAGMMGEQARLGLAGAAVDLIAAREAARLLERGSAEAPISLDLLRSEAAARAILRCAGSAGDAAGAVQAEGLTGMSRVVTRSLNAGVSPEFRAMVIEKVALLANGVDTKEAGASIEYARGVALLQGLGAEANAKSGIALLKRVADGNGLDKVREAALWALGTRPTPAAGRESLDAAASLARLAKEFPGSGRVREALERADALLRTSAQAKLPGALALQRDVIGRALDLTPPVANADDLRSLLMANLALDEERVLDAAELQAVLTGLPTWPDDLAERRGGDQQNAWIVIDRALAGADPKEREGVAGVAARWAAERAPALAARARLAWADALLLNGDAKKAREQVTAIGPLATAALSDAERVRARLTLGRAQRGSGDDEAAFATLRALTDELDHEPTPGDAGRRRPQAFWEAWAEMLEILGAQNKDGGRTPAIRLQVNRLRLIDAQLGGEPWKGRIEKAGGALK
jgi:hypothetical protein